MSYICVCLVAQPCPTRCDPMDCGPPGSSVHGILQARIPEWVTMPSSRGSSQPRNGTQVSALQGILYCLSLQGVFYIILFVCLLLAGSSLLRGLLSRCSAWASRRGGRLSLQPYADSRVCGFSGSTPVHRLNTCGTRA